MKWDGDTMTRAKSELRSNLGWAAILLGATTLVLSYQLAFDSLWNSVWSVFGIVGVIVSVAMLVRSWIRSRRHSHD
jgi:uncharacterized membrane protein YkvI